MNYTNKHLLFIISLAGWFGTLLVSIVAWAKLDFIASDYSVFLPLIFMFIVTFPTLFIASNNRRVIEYDKLNPSSNDEGLSLAPFLKDTPRMFKVILAIVFINFLLSIATNFDKKGTSVNFSYDHYVMTDANNIEKTISKKEYQNYFIDAIKIFSSATLLFLSFTVIILERLVFWEKNDLWALPETH